MAENITGTSRVSRLNPNLSINNTGNTLEKEPGIKEQDTTSKSSIISTNFNRKVDESTITGGVYEPVLITEVCDLPSKGLLYGGELGSTLELRAMTTIEERMRLSGENFWTTMIAILNRCKINTNFDMQNLTNLR